MQDRFGLYRPIVPKVPAEMMSDPDRVRANHAAHAMLQMTKFDLAALKAAYEGTG